MYYGIDSNTTAFPTGAKTKDFYIGRIGRKLTANLDFYNTTGAKLASKKYSYWFLYGPTSDPNYTGSSYTVNNAELWGQKQAMAAYDSWSTNQASLSLKNTIFADVEWETASGYYYGWLTSSDSSNHYTLNYEVFKGFITYIIYKGLNPGCYTASALWPEIMGTNSPIYSNCCFWVAKTSGNFDTPPSSMSSAPSVNGATPAIWQYFLTVTSTGPGDANIASSLPL